MKWFVSVTCALLLFATTFYVKNEPQKPQIAEETSSEITTASTTEVKEKSTYSRETTKEYVYIPLEPRPPTQTTRESTVETTALEVQTKPTAAPETTRTAATTTQPMTEKTTKPETTKAPSTIAPETTKATTTQPTTEQTTRFMTTTKVDTTRSLGVVAQSAIDDKPFDANAGFEPLYTPQYFRTQGVIYDDTWRYTWYSELVLPGGGLKIPGRHTDAQGYVRDENNYLCLASVDLKKGTVVKTPFGYGKVYDSGCPSGTLDVYTNWRKS